MYAKNMQLDQIYISEKLNIDMNYISDILRQRPTFFDYDYAVKDIKEKYFKTKLKRKMTELEHSDYDSKRIVEEIENTINDLAEIQESHVITFEDILMDFPKDLEMAEKLFKTEKLMVLQVGSKT
jgi:replicative DNA helicase